eukprot:m.110137 g.110137  ORF g.110137 m.110137 type:complete len:462 (+) comp28015_c0_seq1:162-1547(+)
MDVIITANDSAGASTHLLHQTKPRVYAVRFWILFQVSLLSFNQSLFWISFSPIGDNAEAFYKVPDSTITWWMNIGVVGGIVGFFPATKYLASNNVGLKGVIVTCAIAQAVAMIARLVPYWIGQHQSMAGITTIYVAQAIIGFVGPAVMAAPPLVSAQWFSERERTRSTAVCCLSNNFGSAIGFLLGPSLVHVAKEVPLLLYTHAAIATANLLLILAYFPARPKTPPSLTADTANRVEAGSSGIFDVLCNFNFMLIAIGGGVINGVFNVWSGSFDQILPPLGGKYTQTTCGWLGFACTIAVIFGGLVIGQLADLPFFRRRKHHLLMATMLSTTMLMVLFAVSLPTIFSEHPLVKLPFGVVFTLVVFAGLTLGATIPLIFELSAEVTFPAPESTSGNVIVLILNIGAFVYLLITPQLLSKRVLNIVISACAVVGVVLFCFASVKYKRMDCESQQQHNNKRIQD